MILENKYIDTTTIRVYVQEDPSEEVRQYYTQADNLVLLTSESRKYWAEETDNGYIRLTFGDGHFGYQPIDGAKIFVSYLVTNGVPFNGIQGIQNFKFPSHDPDDPIVSGSAPPNVVATLSTTPDCAKVTPELSKAVPENLKFCIP